MLTYTIAPPDHCRRLESFLRTIMPQASAGYARKLIKSGAARLNGSAAGTDTFLMAGAQVTLKESAATVALLAERRPVLDILYEDDQIAVVNKPPGLPMHQTAEREPNLVELATSYLGRRSNSPFLKLYPVNRLDRGTSGAVILAKSSTSAGIYGRQVKETGLDKRYLALVLGTPPERGTIVAPLDGKESETRYRLLLAGEGCSLLEVTPISGRMHQIRRHLELIGHPVAGDKRYGGRELANYPGFCLHSFRTVLVRPDAGQLTVCAPLPPVLLDLCCRSGLSLETLLPALTALAG